jgi:transcriptional regulator with XRE-family HTH domain
MPTRIAKRDGPDPVDVHVGKRVREHRKSLGLSQTKLGDSIGLTFQQIQKYERGTNRVSASKLWAIANLFDVPISWFFEGLEGAGKGEVDVMASQEARLLGRYFSACPASVRKSLGSLIRAAGETL